MIKYINSTIVFIIELGMLASFAYFGYQIGNHSWSKIVLAIALPMVIIIIWGYWIAPKSAHRFRMPYVAIVRLLLFLIAAYLLYHLNVIKLAIIMAILSFITQTVSFFTEKD